MNKEDTDFDVNACSPNLLAYVGDAVLELYIRERLVGQGIAKVADLHKTTTEYVSAKGQAKAYEKLLSVLNDDELSVMKRGRNTDSGSVPKNASMAEYRAATGVECLIGWLYLKKRTDRLSAVLKHCFE